MGFYREDTPLRVPELLTTDVYKQRLTSFLMIAAPHQEFAQAEINDFARLYEIAKQRRIEGGDVAFNKAEVDLKQSLHQEAIGIIDAYAAVQNMMEKWSDTENATIVAQEPQHLAYIGFIGDALIKTQARDHILLRGSAAGISRKDWGYFTNEGELKFKSSEGQQ